MIEVFEDRVVVSNPGGLPSDLKPEEFGTRSVARNPVVASLLLRADYIERIGTGINRIRNAVKQADTCSVAFSFKDFFCVEFRLRPIGGLKTGISTENEGDGRLNGGLNGGLNPAVLELFHYVSEHPGSQMNEIASGLSRAVSTLEKQMRKLVEKQLVERRGSRKTGGYWTVGNG